jgi:CheY-like chemotaxis protein
VVKKFCARNWQPEIEKMSYAPQNSAAPQITPLCKQEDQSAPCIELFRPADSAAALPAASDRCFSEDESWRWLLGTMSEGFAFCEVIYDAAGLPVDFRCLEANTAFEPTFGFPAGSVVGRAALEVIPFYAKQSETISLLLTDAMIPNLDGIALMRAVRMINPAAKIVACTGQVDEARQAELDRLNIHTILRKPCSHERLLMALHQELAAANA